MPKAFISYARDGSHGENLAVEIQQQLQAAGFVVFRDVIGLKPGDVWYHKLEFELESSDVMVLVVSEKVRTSKWVHNEVSMAEEIGIPVIPVLAEKVRHPLWLRHLQVLDFCGHRDWNLLVDSVSDRAWGGLGNLSQTNDQSKPRIVHYSSTTVKKTQWANSSDKDYFGDYADLLVKGVTQRFRWIEPGTFWMGSPASEHGRYDNEVRHQVTLTKGYWMADTVCTQALWKTVMGNNPATFKDSENNPIEQVSWDDTQEFLQRLNSMVSNLNVRLPTEVEWEYACRAGTATPFSFGETITSEQVNYGGKKTVPVKSLPANQWGLYEMHGNVSEWCSDANEGMYAIRGGAWLYQVSGTRSAYRFYALSSASNYALGFRIAVDHN